MFVVLAKGAKAGREASELQFREVQAAWLAESGVERAAARLAADVKYTGETWTIPPDELGGENRATVRIEVTPAPGEPNRKTVSVTADYPDDPQHRSRCVKQVSIDTQ